MINGTKLDLFKKEYPNDVYDVGIAEEHAAAMAAGFALLEKPVCLIMYSTFSQRAYDIFLNDIARQNLKVIIGIDRSGIVGEDGSTHQGIYDVAMFGSMPNIKIAMPIDAYETQALFDYAFKQTNPMVIRYPRGKSSMLSPITIVDESWNYLIDDAENEVCVISYGSDLLRIMDIVKNNNLKVSVLNARFIKPIDKLAVNNLKRFKGVLIYEQVVKDNSLGSKIIYQLNIERINIKVKHLAIDCDTIVTYGDIKTILQRYGLGDDAIYEEIMNLCD